MTHITELLGCKYPVLLGAMGVICNPEVVAAVSEAGGFGVLATSFATDVEVFRAQVKATKALTDKPFGTNLQVMNPLSVQFVEVLAEEGVHVITISGGSPRASPPVLPSLRRWSASAPRDPRRWWQISPNSRCSALPILRSRPPLDRDRPLPVRGDRSCSSL